METEITSVLELNSEIEQLQARIGRQAILIEQLQLAIGQGNSDYHKLIANVAKLLSGEVALERFKILPDGLSWQVLALPVDPESIELPTESGIVLDSATSSTGEIKLHESEPAVV